MWGEEKKKESVRGEGEEEKKERERWRREEEKEKVYGEEEK